MTIGSRCVLYKVNDFASMNNRLLLVERLWIVFPEKW